MAFIRTNLGATMVQRHLLEINRNFNTSLERLSTGLRISRPEDSPGEFGMLSLQNNIVRSIERGVINAQNAEGLLQTAEEGLSKIDEILNRMHELAVEAADSTLSAEQRQAAQDEIEALLDELNDVPNAVKYAGVPLLSVAKRWASIAGSALGTTEIDIENSSGGEIISNSFVPDATGVYTVNTVLRIGVSLDGSTPNMGRVVLNFSASSADELAQKVENAIEEQLGGEYVEGGDLHVDVYATKEDATKTRLIFRTSTVAGDKPVASVDDEGRISGSPIIRASEVSTNPVFFSGTSQGTGNLKDDRLKILIDGETVYADVIGSDTLTLVTANAGADVKTITISADDAALFKRGDYIEIRQGVTTGTTQILHIDVSGDTATLYLKEKLSTIGFSNGLTASYLPYIRATKSVYKLGDLSLTADDANATDTSIKVTGSDAVYLNVGDKIVITQGANSTTKTITSISYDSTSGKHTIEFGEQIGFAVSAGAITMKIVNGGQLARDLESSLNNASLYAEDVDVGIDDSRSVVITSGISGTQSYLKILGGSATDTENISLFKELGFTYRQYNQGQGSDFSFQLGGAEDKFNLSIDLVSPTSLGADGVDISDIDVSSQAGANAAVDKLEQAIQSIGTTATKVGSAISAIRRRQDVLEVHRENLIEQRARLQEVDFAQETQKFTQLQILLQSATAVLAQANVVPTTLLQLLG